LRGDAWERARGAAGHGGHDAGQWGYQYHARLGLPPGVHNGALLVPDVLVIPDPRLRVDRLAHRAQQAQRREVATRRVLRAPAHERADSSGGRIKHRYLVLLDDAPEAVFVGIVGRALV